jgi:exodeoxyribonuclease VII large subunit
MNDFSDNFFQFEEDSKGITSPPHDSSVPFSVSALTSIIKANLETVFHSVLVEGEISNAKLASSGHLYFSLKDQEALIQVVMFRYKLHAVRFEPSDGMKVRIRGSISVYPARGQYQLIAQSMQKSGLGDILAVLEERKTRLAAEGLFDQDRKRPLPRLPSRIGVITSSSGAAIRDILNVLRRRNPGIDVVILPSPVQGNDAPDILVKRVHQANAWRLADVLIIGRGGGSIEDLLAFSDEKLVKAIAASKIPTISAVGHEVDWALCDYAADIRAPTPSAAAELVSESRDMIRKEVQQFSVSIGTSMRSLVDSAMAVLDKFSPIDVESRFMRVLMPLARRLDDSREILANEIRGRITHIVHRIELSERSLVVASPQAVLERGYSIVTILIPESGRTDGDKTNGRLIVRSAASVSHGDEIHIQFAVGKASANIVEVDS